MNIGYSEGSYRGQQDQLTKLHSQSFCKYSPGDFKSEMVIPPSLFCFSSENIFLLLISKQSTKIYLDKKGSVFAFVTLQECSVNSQKMRIILFVFPYQLGSFHRAQLLTMKLEETQPLVPSLHNTQDRLINPYMKPHPFENIVLGGDVGLLSANS